MSKRLSYQGRRLLGSVEEFHEAIDLLLAETRPRSYAEKVWLSQEQRRRRR